MNKSLAVCDICGAPATEMARDLQQIPSDGKWMDYEFKGPKRYGCYLHLPIKSRMFLLDGTIDRSHDAIKRLCYIYAGLPLPPLEAS